MLKNLKSGSTSATKWFKNNQVSQPVQTRFVLLWSHFRSSSVSSLIIHVVETVEQGPYQLWLQVLQLHNMVSTPKPHCWMEIDSVGLNPPPLCKQVTRGIRAHHGTTTQHATRGDAASERLTYMVHFFKYFLLHFIPATLGRGS